MDEQRLHGIADRAAAGLRIDSDRDCHLLVGRSVNIGVADARARLDDRHRRVLGNVLDESGAAARDDDIEIAAQVHHGIDGLAVREVDELDDALGDAHLVGSLGKQGADGDI